MPTELLCDIFTTVIAHVKDADKENLANNFVSILVDHDIKESELELMTGLDPALDEAIEYVLDEEYGSDDED